MRIRDRIRNTVPYVAYLRDHAVQSVFDTWVGWRDAFIEAHQAHPNPPPGGIAAAIQAQIQKAAPLSAEAPLNALPSDERIAALAWIFLFVLLEKKSKDFVSAREQENELLANFRTMGLSESEIAEVQRQVNRLFQQVAVFFQAR